MEATFCKEDVLLDLKKIMKKPPNTPKIRNVLVLLIRVGNSIRLNGLLLCLCLTSHQQLRSYGDGAMA